MLPKTAPVSSSALIWKGDRHCVRSPGPEMGPQLPPIRTVILDEGKVTDCGRHAAGYHCRRKPWPGLGLELPPPRAMALPPNGLTDVELGGRAAGCRFCRRWPGRLITCANHQVCEFRASREGGLRRSHQEWMTWELPGSAAEGGSLSGRRHLTGELFAARVAEAPGLHLEPGQRPWGREPDLGPHADGTLHLLRYPGR